MGGMPVLRDSLPVTRTFAQVSAYCSACGRGRVPTGLSDAAHDTADS